MRCRRARQAPAAAQRASSMVRFNAPGISLGPCAGDCARSVARFATPLPQAAGLGSGVHALTADGLSGTAVGAPRLAVTYFRFTVLFGMGRRGSRLRPPDRRLKK